MGLPQPVPAAPAECSLTVPASSVLVDLILSFSQSPDPASRVAGLLEVIRRVQYSAFTKEPYSGLLSLIEYMETNELVRERVQSAMETLLQDLSSLELFARSGIPSDHSLFTEVMKRLVARFLPGIREESDASRILANLSSRRILLRWFYGVPPELFVRLLAVFFPVNESSLWERQLADLREALRVLATRIAWLGLKPEVRDRGLAAGIANSPFYELVACTEELLHPDSTQARADLQAWQGVADRCRREISAVHRHMETEGVSVELVFDLRKIEACFARMEALIAALCPSTPEAAVEARAESPGTAHGGTPE
jgi:site-specific recombinase